MVTALIIIGATLYCTIATLVGAALVWSRMNGDWPPYWIRILAALLWPITACVLLCLGAYVLICA